MGEKRRFDRYNINIPVKVEIREQDGMSETIYLEAINLAAEGVLIRHGMTLPEGSAIKFEVILNFEDLKTSENPEGTLIMSVNGHVIRNGLEGIAIRFNEDYEMSQSLDFLRKEHR